MWAKRASGVSWPQTFHRLKPIQGYVRCSPVQVFFLDGPGRGGKISPNHCILQARDDFLKFHDILKTPFLHHRIRKIFLGGTIVAPPTLGANISHIRSSDQKSSRIQYVAKLAKRGASWPQKMKTPNIYLKSCLFFLLFFSDSFTLLDVSV